MVSLRNLLSFGSLALAHCRVICGGAGSGAALEPLERRPSSAAEDGVSGEDCRAVQSLLLAEWLLVVHARSSRAGAASSAAAALGETRRGARVQHAPAKQRVDRG